MAGFEVITEGTVDNSKYGSFDPDAGGRHGEREHKSISNDMDYLERG